MNVGVILLTHGHGWRATQVAQHLDRQDVPVALHIDADTDVTPWQAAQLARCRHLWRVPRRASPWGSWGLVAATLEAARGLLDRHPTLQHVCLMSGQCLPLRPADQLRAYLAARPGEDFIESVTVDAAPWVVQGLEIERFTLRFPLNFRARPRLHRWTTAVQRRLPRAWHRTIPPGITPSLGAQWWCLSRATLEAIVGDPNLPALLKYFRGVWLPDEAFFQTLARRHSSHLHGQSLTWAPFDSTGRPMVFYDDHLMALRSAPADRFFARKIWSDADRLYRNFLDQEPAVSAQDGTALRRLAARAQIAAPPVTPALPRRGAAPGSRPYTVVYGVDDLFPDLATWVAEAPGQTWLGRVFERQPGTAPIGAGGVSHAPAVARANPSAYLSNRLAVANADHPVLALHPGAPVVAMAAMSADPHARIVAVTGAWTVPMHQDPEAGPGDFAATQRAEAALLASFSLVARRCRLVQVSLEEAFHNPSRVLSALELPSDAVPIAPCDHLPAFLNTMRDAGVNPRLSLPPNLRPTWSQSDRAVRVVAQ